MKTELKDFLPDASAPAEVTVTAGRKSEGEFRLILAEDIMGLFRAREPFSHKGTYGHALLIAGAEQTMGAALLAAQGCLYAGAGLTTAAIPKSGLTALNAMLPEVMYTDRKGLTLPEAFAHYNAIAIGPGLFPGGNAESSDVSIIKALWQTKQPVVADADMLNFMSKNRHYLEELAGYSVLTPHMKEFDRLFGTHGNWWGRVQTAAIEARKRKIAIVLKNQYTFIAGPDGTVFINPTGDPAMAQGGMGDVLTGIIGAYTAQGYQCCDAAMLGCYFHGLAGSDLARANFSLAASQVAVQLPKTIKDFLG